MIAYLNCSKTKKEFYQKAPAATGRQVFSTKQNRSGSSEEVAEMDRT